MLNTPLSSWSPPQAGEGYQGVEGYYSSLRRKSLPRTAIPGEGEKTSKTQSSSLLRKEGQEGDSKF
jgi:hypothetical protein